MWQKKWGDSSGTYVMLTKMKLTTDKISSILGVKNIGPPEKRLLLPPGIYEVVETNESSKNSFPAKILPDNLIIQLMILQWKQS